MTTIAEVKTYVRRYLDVDEEDLPDLFIDPWLQQGFNEMVAAEKRWPSLEKDFEFATVDGVQSYVLATDDGTIVDCRPQDVKAVFLDDMPLVYEEHDRLRTMYPVTAATVSKPGYWSVWSGQLWLWPTPTADTNVTVSYYRKPENWIAVGAGSEPDLPDEFHLPLQEYVLAQAYLQQEDADLADVHMQNFGRMFKAALKAETQHSPQQPIVLGGNRGERRSVGRLRYPFDYAGV